MRVLSVAYPFAPVSRDAVGGAEQILAAIDAALVAAGHGSIVIAREDSRIAGRLIPIPATHDTSPAARAAQHAAIRAALDTACADADIIHYHGIDFTSYDAATPAIPTLVTLHLPPDWYPPEAFAPGRHLICVSYSQQNDCPAPATVIANGVPVGALAAGRHGRRGFALVLGRICPEKGQHLAIDAARQAGTPLLLAGEVFPYPEHQAYYDHEIAPRLDTCRRFLGPVSFARKRRLLAAARCLLIPSLAAETSSLVAMEAAACGTPVIAFAAGALPEIVVAGETGFVVHDVDEMASAIPACVAISPDRCRAEAWARFDECAMTDAYLALYARQQRRITPPHTPPAAKPPPGPANVFTTEAWLEPWWRTFGNNQPLVLRTLRLYHYENKLLPQGVGISDSFDTTDPTLLEQALAATTATVADFPELRPDAALLRAAAPAGWQRHTWPASPCPILPLQPSPAIPAGMRRDIRQARSRAARAGGATIRRATPETLAADLETLIALHAARWRTRGEAGVLADPRVQQFHRDAAPKLLAAGRLRLDILTLRDAPAAAIYALLEPDAILFYLGGFSPDHAYESPGTILLAAMIEEAAAEGRAHADFLRGGEGYKYAWGAKDRVNIGLSFRRA